MKLLYLGNLHCYFYIQVRPWKDNPLFLLLFHLQYELYYILFHTRLVNHWKLVSMFPVSLKKKKIIESTVPIHSWKFAGTGNFMHEWQSCECMKFKFTMSHERYFQISHEWLSRRGEIKIYHERRSRKWWILILTQLLSHEWGIEKYLSWRVVNFYVPATFHEWINIPI